VHLFSPRFDMLCPPFNTDYRPAYRQAFVFPSLLPPSGHSFIHSSHLSFATHPLTFPLPYSEHNAGIAQFWWMTRPTECHPEASAFQGRTPINRVILSSGSDDANHCYW